MNAALVCVDYADILAVTLPYNRHHFDRVLVVTRPDDTATRDIAAMHNAKVHCTNAFSARGATFNKWLALEEALDIKDYRHGWLCLMDADVRWPKKLKWLEHPGGQTLACEYFAMWAGQLCSPYRRMRPELTSCPESEWANYPIHRNTTEWAGYSQIFHCSDPVLGPPPWHQIDWKHAGGADSFFQAKWSAANKVRPPFECLHLGEAGVNWWGRGADPAITANMWKKRHMAPGQFPGEKL